MFCLRLGLLFFTLTRNLVLGRLGDSLASAFQPIDSSPSGGDNNEENNDILSSLGSLFVPINSPPAESAPSTPPQTVPAPVPASEQAEVVPESQAEVSGNQADPIVEQEPPPPESPAGRVGGDPFHDEDHDNGSVVTMELQESPSVSPNPTSSRVPSTAPSQSPSNPPTPVPTPPPITPSPTDEPPPPNPVQIGDYPELGSAFAPVDPSTSMQIGSLEEDQYYPDLGSAFAPVQGAP